MNTEELLKPRYKVIADWPNNTFPIGTVLIKHDSWDNWTHVEETEEFVRNELVGFKEDGIKKYPHLFRKLEWWEERKVEDMPEYVKHEDGRILKPKHFMNTWGKPVPKGCTESGEFFSYQNLTPSTETEYLTYKNSKP